MKISVLTTLLALCLLAFASNVNSKSIEIDSVEVEIIADKSAEDNKEGSADGNIDSNNDSGAQSAEEGDLSDSTQAPETTEAPDSTEVPESTVVPDAQEPDVITIKQIRRYLKDFMVIVEQMMVSVVDTAIESNAVHVGPHSPEVNIHKIRKHIKHLVFTLEHNMMSIIDKISGPHVNRPEPIDPHFSKPDHQLPSHPEDNIGDEEELVKPVPI